jgi:sec-independent protein translocase protein TatA
MPFNLGPTEMVFILVVLLLLFGAKRLPELGSGLGKGIREFRRSMNEVRAEIDRPDDTSPQIHAGQHRPPVGAGQPGEAAGATQQTAEAAGRGEPPRAAE